MKHGSLFSGIGGFDLAAEWMGWTNVFSCEIEEFPRKVLKHHFPNAIHYEDIKQTDFTVHRGEVDVISGGFPCQPFSMAGKRLGKEDERHLWPEMLRAIREIEPRFIVGENVRGILNWSDGLVVDEVYSDLEAEGYEVLTFVLPAAGINAPHRRDRVWFIAHDAKDSMRGGQLQREFVQEGANIRQQRYTGTGDTEWIREEERVNASDTSSERHGGWHQRSEADQGAQWQMDQDERHNTDGVRGETARRGADASDTNGKMLEYRNGEGETERSAHKEERTQSSDSSRGWETFPTQSPVCGGDDGLPRELDGITFSKWRNESIKAYGNAIVPQVAYRIFRAIAESSLEY